MASAQGQLLISTKVPLSKVFNPSCFIRSQCPVVQDWSVLGSFQWLTPGFKNECTNGQGSQAEGHLIEFCHIM